MWENSNSALQSTKVGSFTSVTVVGIVMGSANLLDSCSIVGGTK